MFYYRFRFREALQIKQICTNSIAIEFVWKIIFETWQQKMGKFG